MKIEFLDIIRDKGKYIKRYRNYFSGKYEIIEQPSNVIEYERYKRESTRD